MKKYMNTYTGFSGIDMMGLVPGSISVPVRAISFDHDHRHDVVGSCFIVKNAKEEDIANIHTFAFFGANEYGATAAMYIHGVKLGKETEEGFYEFTAETATWWMPTGKPTKLED